jgi:hypothetical protein
MKKKPINICIGPPTIAKLRAGGCVSFEIDGRPVGVVAADGLYGRPSLPVVRYLRSALVAELAFFVLRNRDLHQRGIPDVSNAEYDEAVRDLQLLDPENLAIRKD